MSTRPLTDMLGRALVVPERPVRIISLCPSQTETLFDLGIGGRVVGSTRYCIHPAAEVGASTRVGGTKKVDLETVRRLSPDLIIAEKEENPREMVEVLSGLAPVYVTEVVDPPSAFEMIRRLGAVTGTEARASALVDEIQAAWSALPQFSHPLRTAYLIWRKPWMAAGPTTYIESLLSAAGLDNVFGSGGVVAARYPEFTLEQLIERRPELVLLSSEPYPFKDKHVEELRSALPGARVVLTDGEPWSWYGSRMSAFPALLGALCRELGRN
jgi:ABC-type Fe3+-hydroxamate transport system substrate-binding protein